MSLATIYMHALQAGCPPLYFSKQKYAEKHKKYLYRNIYFSNSGIYARDGTFRFLERESDLIRYRQMFVILLSVLDKACVGESTR